MKSNARTAIAVSALSCALASGAGLAATSNTTFQVTATVASSCSVSAGALAFGTYDPLSLTDKDATSTINVTCNLLSPYTLKLDGGAINTDISAREMDDGSSNRLGYQLYTTTLRTAIWGDGVTGSTIAGVGTGLSIPHVVYGRIASGQNAPNGSYADTVTVSLDF
jgi:spore coat protein U-like protein